MGNACDPDDDNDGYSDAYELLRGSDPGNGNSTPEICDGEDNDLNDGIDEGFPDSDGDTIKDCLESDIDTDGDTVPNNVDEDDDNDGFSDAVENYVATDSLNACPDSPSHAAWPPDINNDTQVNILDIMEYFAANAYPSRQGIDPEYNKRLDVTADGVINILDIMTLSLFLDTKCR